MTDIDTPPAMALPADATAPRAARAFVSAQLLNWGLAGILDAVVLLISELVTNAVLHAASGSVVTITRSAVGVRLELSDCSRVGPTRRQHSGSSTTGRGLALLDDLADDWGWDRTADGKTIWFVVASDRDPWARFGRRTAGASGE